MGSLDCFRWLRSLMRSCSFGLSHGLWRCIGVGSFICYLVRISGGCFGGGLLGLMEGDRGCWVGCLSKGVMVSGCLSLLWNGLLFCCFCWIISLSYGWKSSFLDWDVLKRSIFLDSFLCTRHLKTLETLLLNIHFEHANYKTPPLDTPHLHKNFSKALFKNEQKESWPIDGSTFLGYSDFEDNASSTSECHFSTLLVSIKSLIGKVGVRIFLCFRCWFRPLGWLRIMVWGLGSDWRLMVCIDCFLKVFRCFALIMRFWHCWFILVDILMSISWVKVFDCCFDENSLGFPIYYSLCFF